MTSTIETSPEELQSIIEENRDLRRQVLDLKSLFEAAKSLGATLDLNKTLENMIIVASNLLKARDASILLVDQKTGNLIFKITHGVKGTELVDMTLPKGHGIAGWVADHGQGLIVNDPENDPRFDKSVSEKLKYKTETLISAPIKSRERVVGVIQLLNKKAGGQFLDEDLKLLESFGSYAGIVLTNSLMYDDIMVEGRDDFERNIAVGIQRSILPVRNPEIPGFEVAVFNHPSRTVRGDYYDYIDRTNECYLVIESTTEQGILASMLATIFRSMMKSIIIGGTEFSRIDSLLKESIRDDIEGAFDKISYSLARVNKQSGNISFFSTGRMVTVHITENGNTMMPAVGQPIELNIRSREKLFFISAGVIDILTRNREGHSPDQKLKEMLALAMDLDPGSLVETVFMALSTINPDVEILEDITLIVLEKK